MDEKNMRQKVHNIKIIELVVFVVIWMAIFYLPFYNNRFFNTVNWDRVIVEWIRMFSFLLIFVLNAFIFVPKFLFQKKYWGYIGLTFVVIILVVGVSVLLGIYYTPMRPMVMPPMNLGPGMPPMELGADMPVPLGFQVVAPIEQKSIFMIILDNLIISILVVGAGTAFKMMSLWLNEEGRRKDVEKEQLKTELALLRHQVSPHFFMNTLNNIHALIDINTETAKDAIIRLSTLMRYLLYDTAHGQTSLKKEIEFIESYITLMQLRFSKKVTITLSVPNNIPDIQIPPMLFISFLENSFKHGVSYQAESFVSFDLALVDNKLHCCIKNSKHKSKENLDKSYSGIGLTNIKKSLALLFDKSYTLDIIENDKEFEVTLMIPIT